MRTALLDSGRRYQEEAATNKDLSDIPDIVVDHLGSLPGKLWSVFHIDSSLGTEAADLHGLPQPMPSTELTEAAASGDLETIEELLAKGVDVNLSDSSANTALIWASERGHLQVVKRLLEIEIVDIDARGYLGASALNRAARRGNLDILQCLVKAGAKLDVPNDKLQYPLHFAAFKQHPDIVKLLLDSGANPRVLDRKGRTPAEDTSSESIRNLILSVMA